jgi:tetratricopeptide (TPR) repeat protein
LTDCFNIPKRNKFFVGREEKLEELNKQLKNSSNIAVIYGMGGVGKSSFILEYAHRAKEDNWYDVIIWISSEKDLLENFRYIAEQFDLTNKNILEEKLIDNIYQKVKGKKSLFIFDNVIDYLSIKKYLPNIQDIKLIHILITTRNEHWPKEFYELKLNIFSKEEARLFLKQHFKEEHDDNLDKLSDLLDSLPLALEQAAAYIKQPGVITIDKYINLFNKSTKKLLDYQLELSNDSYKTIFKTFSLSLEKIKEQEESEYIKLVLLFCSYCLADNIPTALIVKWLELHIKKEEDADFEFNETVKILKRYSLINVSEDKKDVSLHRLVQLVGRLYYQELDQTKLIQFMITQLPDSLINGENITRWPWFSKIIPHATNILEFNLQKKEKTFKVLELLYRLGLYENWLKSNYQKAIIYFDQAIEIIEELSKQKNKELGIDLLKYLIILYHVKGSVLVYLEKYEESLIYQEKSLKLIKNFGLEKNNTRALSDIYHHIGLIYYEQGNLDEALINYNISIKFCEKDLNISKEIKNDEAMLFRLATTLFEIGKIHQISNRSKEAISFYKNSIKEVKKAYGKNYHNCIMFAYNFLNLGVVYDTIGYYDEAQNFYQQSLESTQKIYGTDLHRDFYFIYLAMSRFYHVIKQKEKAEIYFKKIFEIKIRDGDFLYKRSNIVKNSMSFIDEGALPIFISPNEFSCTHRALSLNNLCISYSSNFFKSIIGDLGISVNGVNKKLNSNFLFHPINFIKQLKNNSNQIKNIKNKSDIDDENKKIEKKN